MTATYLAVAEPLVAALAASLLYDRASEIAEAKSDGPGSFQVALLDALWNVTADQVAASEITKQLTATFRGCFALSQSYIRNIYVRCGETKITRLLLEHLSKEKQRGNQ